MGTVRLLAGQEQPRDDAGRIGAQPGLKAARYAFRLAESAGVLRGREHRQGGLGALVEVAAVTFQAVEAGAGRGSNIGVSLSLSPPNHSQARSTPVSQDGWPRDPVRAPAGIGERGHLDRLLVETGTRDRRAATADRGHRQVTIASLGAQQEVQEVQAAVEG